MLLSIIIPTYNRAVELKKNILMLKDYIERNDLSRFVSIVVSDNCSTDNTSVVLSECTHDGVFQVYRQNKNIGLEKNAIFVLEKATSDYVMYLGDDDYIEELYLLKVLEKIKADNSLSCIIPSFVGINQTGKIIENSGRDVGEGAREFKKGYDACFENSYRGHQLSGLVFKRAGLLEAYRENRVSNIYPFIFFVAFSALRGDVWLFPEYPVRVTQPSQDKKDWSYKGDGLISDIFDNYAKLPNITPLQRHLLEMRILKNQSWRFMMYGVKSPLAVFGIITNKNTSMFTRVMMLYLYPRKVAALLLLRFRAMI